MESTLSKGSSSTVKIPIPGDVLDTVLDFFYTADIGKLKGIGIFPLITSQVY